MKVRKPEILLVLILSPLFLVGCGKISTYRDPCENVHIPTIAEIGDDYVVLGNNGIRLDFGDSYSFQGTSSGPHYTIWLMGATPEGAKLRIKSEQEVRGMPGYSKDHLERRWCTQIITAREPLFQHQPKSYAPQVSDFGDDWKIKSFTEAVHPKKQGYYQPELINLTVFFVEAETAGPAGPKPLPYIIYIEIYQFETEDAAVDEFPIRYRGKEYASPDFRSQFTNYTESCRFSQYCGYSGQYDRYLVDISMNYPHQFEDADRAKQMADWQNIVDLVEGKILKN